MSLFICLSTYSLISLLLKFYIVAQTNRVMWNDRRNSLRGAGLEIRHTWKNLPFPVIWLFADSYFQQGNKYCHGAIWPGRTFLAYKTFRFQYVTQTSPFPLSLSLSIYIYIYIYIKREKEKERERESHRKVLNVVSEFVLQSRYYVQFRTHTLEKGMNPLILAS